jgi:hypothetical protein
LKVVARERAAGPVWIRGAIARITEASDLA